MRKEIILIPYSGLIPKVYYRDVLFDLQDYYNKVLFMI